MIKGLIESKKELEKLLGENSSETDWVGETNWFNAQIKHLQHEREVHLIVTLAVGLSGLISIYVSLFKPIIWLLVLDIIFLVLFAAYIFHYRYLENETQRWYSLLRRLKEKVS
ncbi:hypothetical protein JXA34_01845 [Patescibacteria group bacterium]|nr:hypothetical protein [Patescibacteria group bacterium]